jgi:hypothetical protein
MVKLIGWEIMIMKTKTIVLLLAAACSLLLAVSCTGKNASSQGAKGPGSQGDHKFDMSLIKIKHGEKISLDSPQKFIQVYLLFVYEQTGWMAEIRSLSNKTTTEIFLSNKKAQFYNDFGITQKDFDDYSINHMNEINSFLESNPEYKKAFIESQKYLNQVDVNS